MRARSAAVALAVIALIASVLACAPVVMRADPAVAAPAIASDAIITADGARLPLRMWLPAQDGPRAVILALHGFNDYSNFFAMPGAALAGRGIASYAYDQRGFGGAPHRGLWPGIATLVNDLRQAAQVIWARHPGVPFYLLGESMGGAVVMAALAGAAPPPADGAILSAPAVWGRASMPWYQNVALWLAAHTVPGGRVTGGGLGIQATDNLPVLSALGRDPMVIKKTRIDAVFGLVDLMDHAMHAAHRLDGELLVMYGRNDQLIPEGAIREMVARLPAPTQGPQRIAFYPDGWHFLLRDLSAEVVWRDIAAWIEAPARPLPSGADATAAAEGACPGQSRCASVPDQGTRSSAG